MSTNSLPLVAGILYYERNFILSLSDNNQAAVVKHLTLPQDIYCHASQE